MRTLRLALAVVLAFGLLLGLGALVTLQPAQAAPPPTIQSLIDNAPNGGTVSIPSGTYTESLTVNKTLTLTGVSSTTTIIQAISGQRVITVTSGHNLRLENLTVTGGHPASDVGGGVYVANGNLQIVSCRIANNSASYGGGVFQDASGRVDVTDSWIELNTTGNHGGGLYVNGSAALTNTLVLSNTANGHGGGLHVATGDADLIGGLFSNNRALNGNGGAVNLNNSLSVSGTQIISNTALNGGGLQQWNTGYTVTLTNARFERNTASDIGGGAAVSSTLIISSSKFVTNTVAGSSTKPYGGGVYAGGTSQILDSTFAGNSTWCTSCGTWYGGGMYASLSALIQGSTFDSNDTMLGGGVFGGYGPITVTQSTFKNNTASYGGAIYAPTIQADGSTFLNNSVYNAGGGLYGNVITLSGTQFISNTAGNLGGGGLRAGYGLDIVNTLFADNQSTGGGAAIGVGAATAILRYVTISGATLRTMPSIRADGTTLWLTDTIMSNYSIGFSETASTISADYDLLFLPQLFQAQGGVLYMGGHDQYQDPQFANPGLGDFHLAADSPAIDHGIDLGVTTDLDGITRPIGKGYDIGAYESKLYIYLPLILRH